VKELITDH